MSRVLQFAVVGLAVVGLASVGEAQVCTGTPAFSAGSGRLGGVALISDASKAYGGQLALGDHNGWFISGAFAHAKDDNSNGSSNAGGASVGYEWSLNPEHTVQLCPMAGVTAQEGSLVGERPVSAPQNTLDWNFGGTLGWVASSSGSMQVIPAVGAALVSRSYKAKIVHTGVANPTRTDSFGLITGTIGFEFNTRWTISPLVQFPVSETDGKASYGVALSYNFNLPTAMHM